MYNLATDTGKESGIIIYTDDSVGVYNWCNIDDGYFPVLGPFGPMMWPRYYDNEADTISHLAHVTDIRNFLPCGNDPMGSLDIVSDEHMDIPALYGFGKNSLVYVGVDDPYSGDIWSLPSEEIIITLDLWA